MEIKLITSNKKQFLDLLLLADEQESMIDKYLERGEMFALYDDGLKAISVVTCEGEGTEHVDSRRCNVGILLHREHFDGDESHQDNHHGNNAREYRAVYEKS